MRVKMEINYKTMPVKSVRLWCGSVLRDIKILYPLAMVLFLSACGGEPQRKVTIGDAPDLQLPTVLKNANPNLRSRMKPTVKYRLTTDGLSDENLITLLTEEGDNGDVGVLADRIAVTDEDPYIVTVEWMYPLTDNEEPLSLGIARYLIPEKDSVTNIRGQKDTPLNTSEDFVPLSAGDNASGLSNIQALNSLYRGDDISVIYAKFDEETLARQVRYVPLTEFDYIPEFQSDINYDTTLVRSDWGTKEGLVFKDDKGNIHPDFIGVTWSATYTVEKLYIQINSKESSNSPFNNQVRIIINGNSFSPTVITRPTSGSTVFHPLDATTASSADAVIKFSDMRLDYEQNTLPSQGLNLLTIEFLDESDELLASWSGNILIATPP